MKKIKLIPLALLATFGISFMSCNPPGGAGGSGNNATPSGTKPADLSKSIKLDNVQYLATQFVKASTAKAADDTAADSLLAVKEDGSVVSDVMQLPDVIKYASLQPVREVYKNEKAKDGKGTYIVFNWFMDSIKGTDDNTYSIGQMLFIGKDGKVYDIFNTTGNVHRVANSWHKEYSGRDYIKFDSNGNIFIIGKDNAGTTEEEPAIFMWNPLTPDTLKSFKLTGKKNVNFQMFDVNAAGDWIFTYATSGEDNAKDSEYGVYGFNVDSGALTKFYESNEYQKNHFPVKTVAVDNMDRLIYYISGYYTPGKTDGGLFIVPKNTSGSYEISNRKRYYALAWSDIYTYVASKVSGKTIIKYDDAKEIDLSVEKIKEANLDYTEILKLIKTSCNRNADFSLEYFKDKTNIDCTFESGTSIPFNGDENIYKKAEEANALKNEEALKFLFETKSGLEWAAAGNRTDLKGDSLFLTEFNYFCNATSEAKEYKKGGSTMPLDKLLVTSDSSKPFSASELTFLKSSAASQENFLFIRNDKGTWGYNDHAVPDGKNADGSDKFKCDYAQIAKFMELEGEFSENSLPGDLSTTKFYPSWDGVQHEEGDPWKKMPYVTNSKGIAAISDDQKKVYYTENGTVVDLLANDSNTFTAIYSINLDETTLIYNAVKSNGGHITVSIDLETREATKLPFTQKLETMIKLN